MVLAAGFVLATLAFGAGEAPSARFGRRASSIDALGALAFLAVAVGGYAAGGFFTRWIGTGEPFTVGSTPFVVLGNLAILLKVAAGVFSGFAALAVFRAAGAGGGDA